MKTKNIIFKHLLNIRGWAENEDKNDTRNDFLDSRKIYFST